VVQLEATATDDALDLLDLFVTTELIGKAHQDTGLDLQWNRIAR
jgi:hypothetical protein